MDSPKCPKCGFIMCEQFEDTPGPNGVTYATPNGSFKCYGCNVVKTKEKVERERHENSVDR